MQRSTIDGYSATGHVVDGDRFRWPAPAEPFFDTERKTFIEDRLCFRVRLAAPKLIPDRCDQLFNDTHHNCIRFLILPVDGKVWKVVAAGYFSRSGWCLRGRWYLLLVGTRLPSTTNIRGSAGTSIASVCLLYTSPSPRD